MPLCQLKIAELEASNFQNHTVHKAHLIHAPFTWWLRTGNVSTWGVTIMAVDRHLIVQGDGCELMAFGYFCRNIETEEDARCAVDWIGSSKSFGYLMEKARTGTRSDLHEDNIDDAMSYIDDLLNSDESELEGIDLEKVLMARSAFEDDDFEGGRDFLRRSSRDAWEWAGEVGRVPQSRFYRAWGAIHRLNQILKGQE